MELGLTIVREFYHQLTIYFYAHCLALLFQHSSLMIARRLELVYSWGFHLLFKRAKTLPTAAKKIRILTLEKDSKFHK